MIFESFSRMHRYYTKKDGWWSLFVYADGVLAFLLVGFLFARFQVGAFIPISLLCIGVVLALGLRTSTTGVKLDLKGLRTIGLSTQHVGKSALLGLITGFVFFYAVRFIMGATLFERGLGGAVLLRFMGDPRFAHVPETSLGTWLPGALVTVIITVVMQEVLFRGYLSTRIVGLLKSEWVAAIVTAILFALFFVPMQSFVIGRSVAWVFLSYIPLQFIGLFFLHLWLYFLYRVYNHLAAPVLFHIFFSFHSNIALANVYTFGF